MAEREDHREKLDKIQSELQIRFCDPGLLFRCLVHDSYAFENESSPCSNEQLEFLGDAVLGLVVSDLLFRRYPHWREGEMALYKSRLVSAECLAEIARRMNLGDFLFLGKGEQASGGRDRPSILADALEAFIGAAYLDQGFEMTYRLIEGFFGDALDVESPPKDFKSCLQEYSQKRMKTLPHYQVVHEEGPPHRKVFRVRVFLEGMEDMEGDGEGTSKKEAEQKAASSLLEKIAQALPADGEDPPPDAGCAGDGI
jgi:ribonuclease-3